MPFSWLAPRRRPLGWAHHHQRVAATLAMGLVMAMPLPLLSMLLLVRWMVVVVVVAAAWMWQRMLRYTPRCRHLR